MLSLKDNTKLLQLLNNDSRKKSTGLREVVIKLEFPINLTFQGIDLFFFACFNFPVIKTTSTQQDESHWL